jgi:hypothetical protein
MPGCIVAILHDGCGRDRDRKNGIDSDLTSSAPTEFPAGGGQLPDDDVAAVVLALDDEPTPVVEFGRSGERASEHDCRETVDWPLGGNSYRKPPNR